MKLITYMMHYLTSILSLETDKDHDKEDTEKTLEVTVKTLEDRVQTLENNVNEIAFCIQQIAATIQALVSQQIQTSQRETSIEDYLENIKKDDDDGPGYLH